MQGEGVAEILNEIWNEEPFLYLQTDNGPEFRSYAVQSWCENHEVTQVFSRPGKPTDNCFVELFNRVFREECLNENYFESLSEAKRIIEYIPNVDVENTCYTIIFNANGGSLTDNAIQKVMRGERIIAPSIPIREGYAFEGWYRSDDDGITLSGRKWIFTDKIRILVFCTEERIKEALDFGATYAGEEYIDKIKNGWFDFDIAVATPDMMKEVGRLGMSLGRQGLMPNPKTGTVTDDLESAIKEINNMFLISEDLTLYAKWKQE